MTELKTSKYNREEVARRAEAQVGQSNVPGTCQLWTRTIAGGPAVGDFDGDGRADAEDGWKQSDHKHPGDRNAPRGTIVAFLGGSHDDGHRAVSLGRNRVCSTDAPTRGRIGIVTLDWFEKNWGLTYAGWTDDISGLMIPEPPKPELTSRGPKVDSAIKKLQKATGGKTRMPLINEALEELLSIPKIS